MVMVQNVTELSGLQGLGLEVQSHIRVLDTPAKPPGLDLHEELARKVQGLQDHEKQN